MVIEADSYYLFNFGTDLPDTCNTHSASVIQVLRTAERPCEIVGRHQASKVELLDQRRPDYGLGVTYTQGGECKSSLLDQQRRKVTFRLRCNAAALEPEEEILIAMSNVQDNCHTSFDIRSSAGCPIDYALDQGVSTEVLSCLLGLVSLSATVWACLRLRSKAYESV